MWTRLVALALLPLVGLALLAVPMLQRSRDLVGGAEHVERDVQGLIAALELRYRVQAEFVPIETALRSAAFGLTAESGSALLGFDLDDEVARTRRDVDDTIAAWPASAPLPTSVTEGLRSVRASIDADTATLESVHAVYLDLSATLEQLIDAAARTAVATTAGAAQASGVDAGIQRLLGAFDVVEAANAQVEALFGLVLTDDRTAVRAELLRATVRYDETLAGLRRIGTPALAPVIEALAQSPAAAGVAAGAQDEITNTGAPKLLGFAATFRAEFERAALVRQVTLAAGTDTLAVARRAADTARADLARLVAVAAAVAVLTVLAALALAWSISRRLRPLAQRAHDLSEGVFADVPADERGPREVSVMARALNDTVTNLRLLEQQAGALARGDLDDPVLAEPARGGLGEAIRVTVDELSLAWRRGEELQKRLAHQANHDLMTALPNRKAALEALDQALARANRHGDPVWVLFCDLDGFKRANDAFGHHVGDRILRTCAERLAGAVRAGDTVARLGGDEFVVITEHLHTTREAAELANRLIERVSEPIDVDGVATRVGLSVGIGMSLDGRATALDLLRDADNAVHRAKKLGKGRYEVFDEHARDELAHHNELEQALRAALAAAELTLHYQPVTDTRTGELRGFEALARWTRDGAPVSPAEFIPVAEQSDLINDLGRWVLHEATAQLAAWAAEGRFADAYIAVNVSGRHLLSDRLVTDVRDALAASGLDATRLVIEITETVIVADLLTAVAHLEQVRALGVRVALDDFGTGYTSIGQLWRLPIDVLKIDGSFIRHLETEHDHVIVALMIEVAHTLGLALVAEGVETESQQATLRELHCDAVQGFYIARPQPASQIDAARR